MPARERRAREPGERDGCRDGPGRRAPSRGWRCTFCPATTSTRNTSIVRTEGRRSCDSATAAATTTTTTRAPELRDRAQHRRGEVGRVRRAPRREAAIDAREAGVRTHHPEQDADRDRADDDERRAQRSAAVRSSTCGSTRARTNVRTVACGFDLAADDGARRARRGRIRGRPAEDRGCDGRAGAPVPRPRGRARPPYRCLPNVQSVKPRMYANPVDGRGRRWGGFAANPGSTRSSQARCTRPRATGSIPNRAARPSIWPSASTATVAGRRRGADDRRVAYVALSVVMIGLGLILTKVVFDGTSGWDVEVNRWFAHRRTATWNDLSNYGSHVAETLTVIGIAAVVVLVLGRAPVLARDRLPRDRARARGHGVRDDRRSSSTVRARRSCGSTTRHRRRASRRGTRPPPSCSTSGSR